MSRETHIHLETPKGDREIKVQEAEWESTLADILARQGFPLNTRCGQRGLCKGCVVELVKGHLKRSALEADDSDPLRACQARVRGGESVRIRIPARSFLIHEPAVISEFQIKIPFAHDPLSDHRDGENGFGLAVDIGTTTVVVLAVNLETASVLSFASDFNRQMHLGDDVLTRIQHCSVEDGIITRFQELVVQETLLPLMEKACRIAGIMLEEVRAMTVAGNTTMLHLFAGEDPSAMGRVPFTPVFLESLILDPRKIGLSPDKKRGQTKKFPKPNLPIHLLPCLSAYVGADIAGGIYVTGIHYHDAPQMLVDVGTNGEIVLKSGETFLSCATAAGPAFEGSGLTCGMRAVEGVVSHIGMKENPFAIDLQRIGTGGMELLPGLCGTAYIDFLADGRALSLLGEKGRFEERFYATLPDRFKGRAKYGKAICLDPSKEGKAVLITEADLASLLQAKAAIAAGILTLLNKAGLKQADIKTLYLAGGFGLELKVQNAINCGLLPGFEPGQIEVVGNTSLAGAYLSLVDRNTINELERIRNTIEIVELNLDPRFEDHFIDQLCLP